MPVLRHRLPVHAADLDLQFLPVGKPRNRRGDKGFLFLDFATCGNCGQSITGERHIKKSGLRFHYYRCTHLHKLKCSHDRSFIRQDRFAEEVKRNARLVVIPDE